MNLTLLREVEALRRISARYIERWHVRPGGRLRTQDGNTIAEFVEPELANYIARLHAVFVPLTNAVIEMRNRLIDREAIHAKSKKGQ